MTPHYYLFVVACIWLLHQQFVGLPTFRSGQIPQPNFGCGGTEGSTAKIFFGCGDTGGSTAKFYFGCGGTVGYTANFFFWLWSFKIQPILLGWWFKDPFTAWGLEYKAFFRLRMVKYEGVDLIGIAMRNLKNLQDNIMLIIMFLRCTYSTLRFTCWFWQL